MIRIHRRQMIRYLAAPMVATGLARAGLFAAPAFGATPLAQAWVGWRRAHLDPSGRFIDRLKNNASHSEGQGYGMVLAFGMGDRAAFDAMWDWTAKKLKTRDTDNLCAWLWRPETPNAPADMNNASDGDLFVAWGLLRAARAFGDADFYRWSKKMAADIDRVCLRPMPGRPDWAVMMPGEYGFDRPAVETVTLNLSYAFDLPMRELGQEFGLAQLPLASATNRAIVDRMCEYGLPPDWLDVWSEGMTPTPERPAVFGYEALRIPLFELWSGRSSAPAVRKAASLFSQDIAYSGQARVDTPTKADISSQAILERSADPGYSALRAAALCAFELSRDNSLSTPFVADQNYYSATLHMMALVANHEVGLRC